MKMKKIIAAVLSAATVLTMSVAASAETIEDVINSENAIERKTESVDMNADGLVLIFEEQYVDENGYTITDRVYVEDGIMPLATSGTKTIKATKNIDNAYEMWVKGTFSWDSENDTATVSDASYGYERLDSSVNNKISNESFTYKSNQGSEDIFGLGHKYAFVKYSFTMTNYLSYSKNYSLYLDVNTEGKEKIER